MSSAACHASCLKSCTDDTSMSCDACSPGWQLAADGTGCHGKPAWLILYTHLPIHSCWGMHECAGPMCSLFVTRSA